MEISITYDRTIAFFTLALLEIVLGIDNIIFLSILTARLPKVQQPSARVLGLIVAMFTRCLLLLSITWIMRLNTPLFHLLGQPFSIQTLILLLGGLFLLAKSTVEIHHSLEGYHENTIQPKQAQFLSVICQIALLDIVFSLDSVITAVGLVRDLPVMILAIVAAMCVMLAVAHKVSQFIENHPTIKMLALSFLSLVGITLVAESFGVDIPKGYLYFAIGFSIVVESLNITMLKKKQAVKLHQRAPD